MSPAPGRRPPSILESFNVAFEGIIHVLRTQRNMRIHFLIAVAVLIAALAVDVSKIELIVLLLSIAFVLIAEMINTAVEAAVDIASTSFDPMAKLAKDIAAGRRADRRRQRGRRRLPRLLRPGRRPLEPTSSTGSRRRRPS